MSLLMNYKYRFTVFTATYNRCEKLKNLYNNLKEQTFKDFEWVIVNDGSIDDTDSVVKSFIEEHLLDIQYINKSNGGKHTAWSAATPLFQGRYVITADDDDPIFNNMLDIFDKNWSILEKQDNYDNYWEIKARCLRENGNLVGKELQHNPFDSDYITFSYKLKLSCEMVGCRKVEVLQREAAVPIKFPYMDKASNFDEQIRWSRAARKYKTRFISDVVRIYMTTENSLCNNTLNRCLNGDERIIANKKVEYHFALLERRDILLKYNLKQYLKSIVGYSFLSTLTLDYLYIKDLKLIDRMLIYCFVPLCKIYILLKNNE